MRKQYAKKKVILATLIILLVAYYFCLPKQLFDVPYSTVVADRNGQLLGARIAADGQWRFPAGDTVPERFKICLINFEDRHFYRHWGVNPFAIGRAIIQNIKEKRITSGGSTLTMQVIRLSRHKNRTVWEKGIEAIQATRLEFRYSKEKILALYASYAPFGGNVVGLDAAAWRYFGRPADRLSWAETATLAVLPNAPSLLHLSKNRDALLKKRNRLLKRLFDQKIIDETAYELSLSENLPGEPLPLPQIAPHLAAWFYKNSPGKKCISTIDKELQIRTENLLERWNYELRQNDIRNIAAIVIDVKTNQAIAYCGNVRFQDNDASNQVDVIQAERSTGSILKPFLYYAMLQDGDILPRTLLPDVQININGFSPQNFNLQYEGAVPADQAVSRSLNVPLVYMLRNYSAPKFYNFLKQNHIADLPKPAAHYGLSLILGGAEAKLCDLSNAYSTMARSLLNLETTSYSLSIQDTTPHLRNSRSHTTYQPAAVWQVFNALTEVNRPEQIDWKAIPSMQKIAWKTGTSYGFRDAWAIGITPKYVVGVWVGNASGEGRPNLTGARTAGPVMFDVFELLPTSKWFEYPMGQFVEAEICHQSGHLKSRFCEDIDTVLICPNGLHSDPCPFHTIVNLTADEQFRIYETCAEAGASIRKSWFILPPAWAWYYKQHHPEYKSLPPLKPDCGESNYQPMQFIYPQGNVKVNLPKQLDGTIGEITFELAHNNPQAVIFWHIDNEYIASTTDFHKLSVRLLPGVHSVTVVDNEGNTLSCRIEAVDSADKKVV
ncbi:MAG: penicillin-binding protein 1C [Dysgonamonadaceae bacterium]|jgi:penicillin-binding protein 1C|nr:penicillin-binding protein 1C [Dysgonamonadaceae bacterium]